MFEQWTRIRVSIVSELNVPVYHLEHPTLLLGSDPATHTVLHTYGPFETNLKFEEFCRVHSIDLTTISRG